MKLSHFSILRYNHLRSVHALTRLSPGTCRWAASPNGPSKKNITTNRKDRPRDISFWKALISLHVLLLQAKATSGKTVSFKCTSSHVKMNSELSRLSAWSVLINSDPLRGELFPRTRRRTQLCCATEALRADCLFPIIRSQVFSLFFGGSCVIYSCAIT